ncbi:hypothetical protein FD13_GL001695 [Levilactobacillus senmaizukei DSM 21775 = NBRC 103853]|uniref:Uncharacterized protein n=1 Tax=Levilactobacillus senmaizukei DSM 21775 = NBRC 103853 TaxID=1423803 RepID=A0A0R2DRJ9_9LACO|nr:hypothetical protein FD13_GL001695 [Levilactobacillus senmaizukei DSM 21775 = NBRC 103853]
MDIITWALLIAILMIKQPIIVAFLAFSSLITIMLHFNIFEDTRDTNPLTRIDLGVQVVFILVGVVKAFIYGGGRY